MKCKITLLIMLVCIILNVSCDKDAPVVLPELQVVLDGDVATADYSAFTITVKELRSGQQYKEWADKSGKVSFSLPYGQYDVEAEDLQGDASTMYGVVHNFTFGEHNNTCKVEVQDIRASLSKTFVLDKLFFNCSSNGDFDNNYYEEYFTISNVSGRPLYADGISFGICGDYNASEDDGIKSAYLQRDSIVLSQMYTIPGNGRQYLVMPGESLVIAHSAIDHTSGGEKKNALNLTGADFEIYVPYEYSMTTDNPEVPNLNVNFTTFQAFSWGYTGYAPLMILRADTDLDKYVASHLRKMKVTLSYGDQQQDYLIVPTSWIVDAAETGCEDSFLHKVLPLSVDKSNILIQDDGVYGGFKGQFVKRKSDANGNLIDTNDSQNDFEVIPNGQKNYPKN